MHETGKKSSPRPGLQSNRPSNGHIGRRKLVLRDTTAQTRDTETRTKPQLPALLLHFCEPGRPCPKLSKPTFLYYAHSSLSNAELLTAGFLAHRDTMPALNLTPTGETRSTEAPNNPGSLFLSGNLDPEEQRHGWAGTASFRVPFGILKPLPTVTSGTSSLLTPASGDPDLPVPRQEHTHLLRTSPSPLPVHTGNLAQGNNSDNNNEKENKGLPQLYSRTFQCDTELTIL